jgi:hypothetical protein
VPGFEVLGRALIILGIVIVILGAVLIAGPRIPFLGRLPGDIRIEREGVTIYIPIATMILVSIIASIVLAIVTRR